MTHDDPLTAPLTSRDPEREGALLENEDLVVLGGGEWHLCPREPDFLGVLTEVGTRTLVLESPGMRRPSLNIHDLVRIWGRIKRLRRVLEPRGPGIHALTPLTLPFPGSAWVRRLNAWIQHRALVRSMRKLGFKKPIVLITSPIFHPLVDLIDSRLVVYDCHDDWLHFPGIDTTVFGPLETALLARADVVLAASDALREAKQATRADIVVLRNGVHPERFGGPEPDEPEDMRSIAHPRLGYVGNIYSRLDVELLEHVARARPDWSIVLVGLVRSPLGPLTQRPNVHVLGLKSKHELPAYTRHLDVGLLPHRLNGLTNTQDPTKIYEYLAAGLPVVATDLAPLDAFGPFVQRARDAEDFVAQVAGALANDGPAEREARREEAARHSWRRRAAEFSSAVRAGLEQRSLANRGT